MKKFLLLIAIALVSVGACKKDNSAKQDPEGLVAINIQKGTRANDDDRPLTPYEIVRLKGNIQLFCYDKNDKRGTGRGFIDDMIDTVNNRLLMGALEIYDPHHGGLQDRPEDFLGAHYAFIIHFKNYDGSLCDTVAYIPRATLEQARKDIRKAFHEDHDWEKMYSLFQEAFTATPCTGKQWRELRKNGQY